LNNDNDRKILNNHFCNSFLLAKWFFVIRLEKDELFFSFAERFTFQRPGFESRQGKRFKGNIAVPLYIK
jgi:hypothetical protein